MNNLKDYQFNKIIDEAINNVLKEVKREKPILPYHRQKGKNKKDSCIGTFLRYSPEDSSFDSRQKWNVSEDYDSEQMAELIDQSMNALGNAREYARTNGHGNWFNLLNAILGELSSVLEREHGTGEVWGGKEQRWVKPSFIDYKPLRNEPW